MLYNRKKNCREVESNRGGGFYFVKDGSKKVIEIKKIEKENTI